jgi:hypothetical protein
MKLSGCIFLALAALIPTQVLGSDDLSQLFHRHLCEVLVSGATQVKVNSGDIIVTHFSLKDIKNLSEVAKAIETKTSRSSMLASNNLSIFGKSVGNGGTVAAVVRAHEEGPARVTLQVNQVFSPDFSTNLHTERQNFEIVKEPVSPIQDPFGIYRIVPLKEAIFHGYSGAPIHLHVGEKLMMHLMIPSDIGDKEIELSTDRDSLHIDLIRKDLHGKNPSGRPTVFGLFSAVAPGKATITWMITPQERNGIIEPDEMIQQEIEISDAPPPH